MAYVKDLQEIEFGIILHASPSEVQEPAPHCRAANQPFVEHLPPLESYKSSTCRTR